MPPPAPCEAWQGIVFAAQVATTLVTERDGAARLPVTTLFEMVTLRRGTPRCRRRAPSRSCTRVRTSEVGAAVGALRIAATDPSCHRQTRDRDRRPARLRPDRDDRAAATDHGPLGSRPDEVDAPADRDTAGEFARPDLDTWPRSARLRAPPGSSYSSRAVHRRRPCSLAGGSGYAASE